MWRDDLRQCAQILRAAAEDVPAKPYPGYVGNAQHLVLWKAQDLEFLANSGTMDEKVWADHMLNLISRRELLIRQGRQVEECSECLTALGHSSNCSKRAGTRPAP